MNEDNVLVLNRFTSRDNVRMLEQVLTRHFGEGLAGTIHSNMNMFIGHFIDKVAKELLLNRQGMRANIVDHVNTLNDYFLSDRIEFIRGSMLNVDKRDRLLNNNVYAYNDGHAAVSMTSTRNLPRQVVCDTDSRKIVSKCEPCDELTRWRYPSRGVTLREDTSGDVYGGDTGGVRANMYTGDGYQFRGGTGTDDVREGNRFGFDDVAENSDNAINMMMNDPKVQLLNRVDDNCKYGKADSMPQSNNRLWSSDGTFVDENNQAEMDRYMKRRVFRSWDGSKQETAAAQIPWWRKSIQHRHVDRDVKDALGGNVERNGMQRGHDMESLYCRVDANRETQRASAVAPFVFKC